MLLKYLGETSSQRQLSVAVAVSVPFRLDHCADRTSKGLSKVHQARFLRNLRQYVDSKQQAFHQQGRQDELARLISLETLKGMKTLWDVDERVTAPLHGFDSAASILVAVVAPFLLMLLKFLL